MLGMRSGHESLWPGGTAMEDSGRRLTFPPPRDNNACCHPFPHNCELVQKSQISALFCEKWHLRVPTVGNVLAC